MTGRVRRVAACVLIVLLGMAVSSAAQSRHAPDRERPRLLVPLYVMFGGLQALDAHSTITAVEAGAREANPVVRHALGTPGGMLVLKGATAAAVVVLSERLWPHNRTAAVLTMIALNSAYITIAAHNYRSAARRPGGQPW